VDNLLCRYGDLVLASFCLLFNKFCPSHFARCPQQCVCYLTSCYSADSKRPHRCCHQPNNFGSRQIFPILYDGPGYASYPIRIGTHNSDTFLSQSQSVCHYWNTLLLRELHTSDLWQVLPSSSRIVSCTQGIRLLTFLYLLTELEIFIGTEDLAVNME